MEAYQQYGIAIATLLGNVRYTVRWKTLNIFRIFRDVFYALAFVNTWTVYFEADTSAHSKYTVLKLLKQYHIPSWGWNLFDHRIYFQVRKSQAIWVEDILIKNGVPICGPMMIRNKRKPAKRKTKR